MADLRARVSDGVLLDATHSPDFVKTMADLLTRRRTLPGRHGQIVGLPSSSLRRDIGYLRSDLPATPLSGEQSNSSVLLGDQAIMKFIRRFEEGVNPGVEISRFLSEQAASAMPREPAAASSTGATPSDRLRPRSRSSSSTFPTRATGGSTWWMPSPSDSKMRWPTRRPTRNVLGAERSDLQEQMAEPCHPLVGPHLEWASLLGRRTAEMHVALAGEQRDPTLSPNH